MAVIAFDAVAMARPPAVVSTHFELAKIVAPAIIFTKVKKKSNEKYSHPRQTAPLG
jgi:hypothetical protein